MKNGIGPQNLGAAGMNPKSTPCGSPLDFNPKLRAALPKIKKNNPNFAEAIEADPGTNYGTPLDFQDDISKIQEAASTLEAHNIGSGGGAAAAAPAGDVGAQQASMAMDSMGGGNVPGNSAAMGGRFTKGIFGLLGREKRRV